MKRSGGSHQPANLKGKTHRREAQSHGNGSGTKRKSQREKIGGRRWWKLRRNRV